MKTTIPALACALLLGCTESQPPKPVAATRTTPPAVEGERRDVPADNSRVNVRDRDGAAKTPIDQNENKEDIRITADIRKRVVDKKLSVDAQNVKIITQDGKVTLRGPVKTDEEKQVIEEIALAIAGANKVESHLEVSVK